MWRTVIEKARMEDSRTDFAEVSQCDTTSIENHDYSSQDKVRQGREGLSRGEKGVRYGKYYILQVIWRE